MCFSSVLTRMHMDCYCAVISYLCLLNSQLTNSFLPDGQVSFSVSFQSVHLKINSSCAWVAVVRHLWTLQDIWGLAWALIYGGCLSMSAWPCSWPFRSVCWNYLLHFAHHKSHHHKTRVPNRAVGACWGGHGLHQQGHERGREESDRHGSVLWSLYLANQE